MKLTILISTLLGFMFHAQFATAKAGIIVGNGGLVISCKDDTGHVLDLEAFDLFEGRRLWGYSYPSSSQAQDPLVIAREFARKLDAAQGSLNSLTAGENMSFVARVEHVAAHLTMIPHGQKVPPSGDTKEHILFPVGCELIQGINFRDPQHIDVSSDIWDQISIENKAALYVHEAVYWYLRETGVERDSRRTRKTVAYLMSGGELTSRIALPAGNWLHQVQYCKSSEKTPLGIPSTEFFAYTNTKGELTVQILQVDSYRMLTQTLLVGPPGSKLGQNPLQPRGGKAQITDAIQSPLDSEGTLELTWGTGVITISGVLQLGSSLRDFVTCVDRTVGR